MRWLLCIVYTNQEVQYTRFSKCKNILMPELNCLAKSAQEYKYGVTVDGNMPKSRCKEELR